MKRIMALLAIVSLLTTGCYNTYRVPEVEFRKLQSRQGVSQDSKLAAAITDEAEREKLVNRAEGDSVTVRSLDNKEVAVSREARIYARSQGGRRYQVTPFNFSMYASQLVASDRDTLLPVSDVRSWEVDLFSTGKTVGMVSVGAVAAIGFIAVIIAVSGQKSFTDQ